MEIYCTLIQKIIKITIKGLSVFTDLVPVYPNCHSIIHRKKNRTLSIAEMKAMIAAQRR